MYVNVSASPKAYLVFGHIIDCVIHINVSALLLHVNGFPAFLN